MAKAGVFKSIGESLRKFVNVDGWFNILTGLGTTTLDKRMNAQVDWYPPTEMDCDMLYASDDIAAKVCDILPEDAMREGLQWIEMEKNDEAAMEAEYLRLKVLEKSQLGWTFGRLYGGAGVVLITDDGAPMDEPLDLGTVRRFVSMAPLSRWELFPFQWDYDIRSDNFGYPELYQIQPRVPTTAQAMFVCHHTRIIRFDGPKLPIRLSIMNWRWGDSVLTRLRVPLINYVTSMDAAASAVQDFRFNIFKLRNLSALMAAGQSNMIQQRLQLINMTKSIARAVVVEEGEEFTTEVTNFQNLDKILDKLQTRLQAATPVPHTRLFGESPEGLGGTGRHEETNWYDYVKAKQMQVLKPRLEKINDIIFAAKAGPFRGKKPKKGTFEFAPLWQLDEKEEVAMRKDQAMTDQIYMESGVLEPLTVAANRFGGQKYSIETKLPEMIDEYKPKQWQEIEPSDKVMLDTAEKNVRLDAPKK